MTALVRKAVRYELGMWRSLLRWTFRRPAVPGGATPFGYAGLVTPIFIAFIVVSAIEVPIVHLLLPWRGVQLTATAAGVYGLFWMIGLLASLRVHPHTASASGLRIRYGISVDIEIPWDAVEAVRKNGRDQPGRTIQLAPDSVPDGAPDRALGIGIMKQTNIDVTLRHPVSVRLPKGPAEISELRCYVDDPGAFVTHARRHLAAAPESSARPR